MPVKLSSLQDTRDNKGEGNWDMKKQEIKSEKSFVGSDQLVGIKMKELKENVIQIAHISSYPAFSNKHQSSGHMELLCEPENTQKEIRKEEENDKLNEFGNKLASECVKEAIITSNRMTNTNFSG